MVLLPGPPHTPPTPPPRCICLSWLGGGVFFIPGTPHETSTLLSISVLVGRDGFYQTPLAHPRLHRGPCYVRKIQLTPCIPTRMSYVGSLATDLRLSCHYFCCNSNTIVRPIQIEEKALNINSFILQLKERYLRPRVIVVSITMPPSAGMAT